MVIVTRIVMIVPLFSVLVLEIHIRVNIGMYLVWKMMAAMMITLVPQVIVVSKLVGLFVGILFVMLCVVTMPVSMLY